jgi:alanyl-tRNA synthetase
MPTERLYYSDSALLEFDAKVVEVRDGEVVLDRTAFYPESGGQLADRGTLTADAVRAEVTDVQESESGEILHFVAGATLASGARVRGQIDARRRRDHMQQHSGQHVLSAAFLSTMHAPTFSFHMGEETCSIDLDVKSITPEQMSGVAALANSAVMGDLEVTIRSAMPEEARAMGVRKIPPDVQGALRLIDMGGFDLNACGGTHVARTGQIGPILLRKAEKVKQGVRVEFVCGERALAVARRDYEALTQAAAVYSTNVWDVPQQVRKSLEEMKAAQKERKKLLEELAEFEAAKLVADAEEERGLRWVRRVFADRDLSFVKLLAQKMVRWPNVVALLAAGQGQPSVVVAQSAGVPFDMGRLIKEASAEYLLRGGGARDLAQAGVPEGTDMGGLLTTLAEKLANVTK